MRGVSTDVSKTVVAPIERVKLLIQNQHEMLKAGRLSKPYKGIGECFVRSIKEKGFVSLSRGNTANALNFAFKDYFKSLFNFKKTEMVTGSGLPETWDLETLASDGIARLYRGLNISCAGIIVYHGLYFGLCDSLKPVLLTDKLQVRDELERILDDDDDMADLLYVNLQELYQAKAEVDFLEVEQCVIDILKKVGRDPYRISKSVKKPLVRMRETS
nr:ADP,ATP carrier protein 1, mitochondrial-like [Tanacetum cinerariifolium]